MNLFKFDHQNVALLMPSLCEQLELVSVSIKLFREAGSPSGLAAGFEIWSSQVQLLHRVVQIGNWLTSCQLVFVSFTIFGQ